MKDTDFNKVFKLPFAEASQFFRDKLTIETSAWNDLTGAAHAKAFTSAGAYHADLLADLRKMTDKAIAGGMDIREFRKQFLPLVERYGWQLQGGGAAWRSDLIWRTNIATAYQAGRWDQFRAGNVEYLMYVHKDGLRYPRPNHVALDGMIYPINDPFWRVNFTPNGFGCHCRVVMATRSEYEAAPGHLTTRPDGWENMADAGWNYNVGLAGEEQGYRSLTGKFNTLPNDIARSWLNRFIQEPAFDRFVGGKITGDFPIGILRPGDFELLKVEQQTVWISSDALANNSALSIAEYRLLPEVIDTGDVYRHGDELFIELQQDGTVFSAELERGSGDGGLSLSHFSLVPGVNAGQRDSKWKYQPR
jgi:SPP1 gp7 family putative phage head morphogenesis protein